MLAKDHQPLPHPSMTKEGRKEAKRPPRWSTSWPSWFGIFDNVTVVPEADYLALEKKLSTLQSAFMECVANKERAEAKAIELTNKLCRIINQIPKPDDTAIEWAKTILAGRIAQGIGPVNAAEDIIAFSEYASAALKVS